MKHFHRLKRLMQRTPPTKHIDVGVLSQNIKEGGSAVSDMVEKRICPGGATIVLLRELWRQEKVIGKVFNITRVDFGGH
jgi:hypothetical protein